MAEPEIYDVMNATIEHFHYSPIRLNPLIAPDLEKSLNSTNNANVKIGEKHMAYASEVAKLKLTADDRLLIDENIITDDGTLSSYGRDFVVQVLFEADKAEVIKTLRDVVAARKPEEE